MARPKLPKHLGGWVDEQMLGPADEFAPPKHSGIADTFTYKPAKPKPKAAVRPQTKTKPAAARKSYRKPGIGG
jgi:hypothetical protein